MLSLFTCTFSNSKVQLGHCLLDKLSPEQFRERPFVFCLLSVCCFPSLDREQLADYGMVSFLSLWLVPGRALDTLAV